MDLRTVKGLVLALVFVLVSKDNEITFLLVSTNVQVPLECEGFATSSCVNVVRLNAIW